MAKNDKLAAKAKGSTAIATPMEDWEVVLANKAKAAQASEVVGIPRITHRGGILKIDDKKVEGNKLKVAIVAYGRMNTFFEKDFDPETSKGETPDCYAFGTAEAGAEENMKPHPAAPKKQSDQCQGCRWNEFGSGKGNSKKCGNYRKLLVVLPSGDPDSLAKAQVRQIAVPPGSLKGWGNYLSAIEEITPLGHIGVVTEITTEPLDTGAYKLLFRATDRLDKEFVKALAAKAPSLERHLSEAFPVIAKTEAQQAKKPAKKIKGQG